MGWLWESADGGVQYGMGQGSENGRGGSRGNRSSGKGTAKERGQEKTVLPISQVFWRFSLPINSRWMFSPQSECMTRNPSRELDGLFFKHVVKWSSAPAPNLVNIPWIPKYQSSGQMIGCKTKQKEKPWLALEISKGRTERASWSWLEEAWTALDSLLKNILKKNHTKLVY